MNALNLFFLALEWVTAHKALLLALASAAILALHGHYAEAFAAAMAALSGGVKPLPTKTPEAPSPQ